MCSFGGGPSLPPPPPQPTEDIAAKERRKRERDRLAAETTQLKQEQYERRVNASYGRRGRRSLLSGNRGGRGFGLEPRLMSKDTLGQ